MLFMIRNYAIKNKRGGGCHWQVWFLKEFQDEEWYQTMSGKPWSKICLIWSQKSRGWLISYVPQSVIILLRIGILLHWLSFQRCSLRRVPGCWMFHIQFKRLVFQSQFRQFNSSVLTWYGLLIVWNVYPLLSSLGVNKKNNQVVGQYFQ